VEAPDWDPTPEYGHGLHGLLWGVGDSDLLDWAPEAKWLVVEVDADVIVDLGDNVKFPRGTVVHCGDRLSATKYIIEHGADPARMVVHSVTAGDYDIAMAGDYSIATSGYKSTAMVGKYGTATVGSYGTAMAGDRGIATAKDRGAATAGYGGVATADDWGVATAGRCGTAKAGRYGTATAGPYGTAVVGDEGIAMAGKYGTAAAGYGGTVVVHYLDEDTGRMRLAVGYVGESGIEANRAYRVKYGKLVLADEEESELANIVDDYLEILGGGDPFKDRPKRGAH